MNSVDDGKGIIEVDEEEECNLYLKIIKTISIKVKKSDNLRNLKKMLNEKEGIPECHQEMFFNGSWLNGDNRLIIDNGIQHNSTLDVFVQSSPPLRLNVKRPSKKKTITIEAKIYDNIWTVKSLISARENIQVDDFHLVFAGKSLAHDVTLASIVATSSNSSILQEVPTVYMVSTPKYQVSISVKMLSGEMLKLQVNLLQTVSDLKALVESIGGFSLDDLIITFNNKKLLESMTLHYYNIQEHSVLEISAEFMQVFIRDAEGVTRVIVISKCNSSVKDLKDRIFQKMGIPVRAQRLLFEGKFLNDERDLASYNISKNSSISLIVWA